MIIEKRDKHLLYRFRKIVGQNKFNYYKCVKYNKYQQITLIAVELRNLPDLRCQMSFKPT